MKTNILNLPYTSPDTVWCALREDSLLCQSSTLPDLDEGRHDFNWNY